MPEEELYSLSKVREILGIGETKLYDLLKCDLPALKIGKKTVVKRSALNAYIDSLPQYRPVWGWRKNGKPI